MERLCFHIREAKGCYVCVSVFACQFSMQVYVQIHLKREAVSVSWGLVLWRRGVGVYWPCRISPTGVKTISGPYSSFPADLFGINVMVH